MATFELEILAPVCRSEMAICFRNAIFCSVERASRGFPSSAQSATNSTGSRGLSSKNRAGQNLETASKIGDKKEHTLRDKSREKSD